jgi:protein-S-isoprenylcysteine O-methyltransferase Ste14
MSTFHLRARQRARQTGPGAAAASTGATARLPRVQGHHAALAVLGLPTLWWVAATLSGTALWRVSAWPAAGGALATAGLAWAAWAAWTLLHTGNPLTPGAPPQVLVDSGPFARGRHPVALGLGLALAGAALGTGSIPAAATALAWVVAQSRWLIPAEEAQLRATFGGWYRDYEARTRRWL